MRRREGYSLLEVLLVCAVVGITIAAAVPNLRSYRESQRMAGISQQLASECRAAQARARSQNHDVVIQYDADAETYAVIDDLNGNGQADDGETVTLRTLPEGLGLRATTLADDRLVFDSRGRARNGGSVVVVGGQGVEPRRLRISSGTGHIKVLGCEDDAQE